MGRLWAYKQTTDTGQTLAVRPLGGRAVLSAMTPKGDLLAVATSTGSVYCLHLENNRYSLLEDAGKQATAATFMARCACRDIRSQGGKPVEPVAPHPPKHGAVKSVVPPPPYTVLGNDSPTTHVCCLAWCTRLTRRLYVAFGDGSLAAYDANTSGQLARLSGSRSAIRSLSTRASSDQLASGAADSIALWDAHTLRQQRLVNGAPYGTLQASFSPDEATLVAVAADGTFSAWCAKSQKLMGRFAAPGCAGEAPAWGGRGLRQARAPGSIGQRRLHGQQRPGWLPPS